MFKKFTPEMRLYLYGIATAAVPLLIGLGWLNEGVAQDIIFLVAALLAVASPRMSAANVTVAEKPTPATDERG